MQNKRLLIPTIAALIISISCFMYVKCSLDKQELLKVETKLNQPDTEVEETDMLGLGFSDINIIQRLGSTFRFLTTIR